MFIDCPFIIYFSVIKHTRRSAWVSALNRLAASFWANDVPSPLASLHTRHFDLFCQVRVKLQLFCDDFINSQLIDSKWKKCLLLPRHCLRRRVICVMVCQSGRVCDRGKGASDIREKMFLMPFFSLLSLHQGAYDIHSRLSFQTQTGKGGNIPHPIQKVRARPALSKNANYCPSLWDDSKSKALDEGRSGPFPRENSLTHIWREASAPRVAPVFKEKIFPSFRISGIYAVTLK